MGKKKGSAKTGGRTAGTPNKVTKRTKDIIVDAISSRADKFEDAMDAIFKEDKALFAALYIKLLPYVTPRLNAVDISDTTKRDKGLEDTLKEMAED